MKVLLIEDQNLLAGALAAALEKDRLIEIVACSDKASDVIRLCETHKPDIVVMDVYTSDGNGIDYTARLKTVYPHIKVLVISGIEDPRLVKAAEAAGADLFAWKNVTLDELVTFIRNAHKPYRVFPNIPENSRASADFSAVDIQIISLLARGKSTREIAEVLFLGYGTVRLYISRMFTATGLKSRAQLVAYALACGLIENTP